MKEFTHPVARGGGGNANKYKYQVLSKFGVLPRSSWLNSLIHADLRETVRNAKAKLAKFTGNLNEKK